MSAAGVNHGPSLKTATVTVQMTPEQWWALSTEAERLSCRIADLVVATATKTLEGRLTLRNSIEVLVRVGFDDGYISRQLGLTRATVANTRRAAGLPANKKAKAS